MEQQTKENKISKRATDVVFIESEDWWTFHCKLLYIQKCKIKDLET